MREEITSLVVDSCEVNGKPLREQMTDSQAYHFKMVLCFFIAMYADLIKFRPDAVFAHELFFVVADVLAVRFPDALIDFNTGVDEKIPFKLLSDKIDEIKAKSK